MPRIFRHFPLPEPKSTFCKHRRFKRHRVAQHKPPRPSRGHNRAVREPSHCANPPLGPSTREQSPKASVLLLSCLFFFRFRRPIHPSVPSPPHRFPAARFPVGQQNGALQIPRRALIPMAVRANQRPGVAQWRDCGPGAGDGVGDHVRASFPCATRRYMRSTRAAVFAVTWSRLICKAGRTQPSHRASCAFE